MSDCDCEKKDIKKIENSWPMEGDVGDNFLNKDNFPMILQIKRNLKNYTINKESAFNQQLIEDKLNNLNLEDTENETAKENVLIDLESDVDSEDIYSTEEEEETSTEEEEETSAEEEKQYQDEEFSTEGEEDFTEVNSEEIIEKVSPKIEIDPAKKKVEEYLNNLL
jgi:hypothetical protein